LISRVIQADSKNIFALNINRQTIRQFWSYVCVGFCSVAVDILSLVLFTRALHLNTTLAATLSYGLGLAVVFILNKYWSFKSYGSTLGQLKRYLLLMSANYLIVVLAMYLLCDRTGVPPLIAKVGIIGIQTIWNFLLYKFWIFRNPND